MISFLFQCPVCRADLKDPVTMSCGYTVRDECLPAPSSSPPLGGHGSVSLCQRTCKCPVQDCHVRGHVLIQDRKIHVDSEIDTMLATRQRTPSSCGWKRFSPATVVNNNGSSRIDHEQQPTSVFVTDVVILPGQHVRLPVYAPAHIRMLREAAFGDWQRGKVCLATVHRARALARYGTVVEIVSIKPATLQHGRSAGMVLDVVGRERVKISLDKAVPCQRDDSSAVAAFCEPIAADKTQRAGDIHVSDIRRFLINTAQRPPPAIAWGRLWFVTMEHIHGPLPPATSPVEDLLWWAAIALPISDTERYRLLCRVSLHARLSLVHSWTRQLRSQWSLHRPR